MIRIKEIKIYDKTIGINSPIFLIAEAGVNHNGKLSLAKKLVDVAVKAKVDAIKFQTFNANELMLKTTPKVEYQKVNEDNSENFYELIKKLTFTEKDFIELKKYCDEKDIGFLSTPFGESAVELLEKINVPVYKISSGDMNNLPFLRLICTTRKPIFLSTGMANLDEVKESVDFIKMNNINDIVIFQCTTRYPASLDEINLNVIDTYKKEFPDNFIGFSDHSLGFEASIGAAAKGAKVIEKHFTLDKKMEGPDHKASLNPTELKEWVTKIRDLEVALGTYVKHPTTNEIEIAKIVRKSIVTKKNLKKGDILREDNITIKRPGVGISPREFNRIIGKKIKRDLQKNSIILWEDIQ